MSETLSASQFGRFLDCRYQYSLWKAQTEVEREAQATPAMLRGRAIHENLAAFYRLPPRLRAPIGGDGTAEGAKMVHQFNQTFGQDENYVPTMVELRLEREILPGVNVVGILDALGADTENKTLWIGEHKTTSRKPQLSNMAHFSLQPVVYQWLTEGLFPSYSLLSCVYTAIWPTGAARYTRRMFELGKWRELLSVLAAEMLAKPVYYPSYGLHCSWCSFQSVCLGEMGGVVDEPPQEVADG